MREIKFVPKLEADGWCWSLEGLFADSTISPSQGHGEVVGCLSPRSLRCSHSNVSAKLPALMSPLSCLPSSFKHTVPSIPRHCSVGPFTRKWQGSWHCWTTDQPPRHPLSPNIQPRVPGALLTLSQQCMGEKTREWELSFLHPPATLLTQQKHPAFQSALQRVHPSCT